MIGALFEAVSGKKSKIICVVNFKDDLNILWNKKKYFHRFFGDLVLAKLDKNVKIMGFRLYRAYLWRVETLLSRIIQKISCTFTRHFVKEYWLSCTQNNFIYYRKGTKEKSYIFGTSVLGVRGWFRSKHKLVIDSPQVDMIKISILVYLLY